ncbi:MAG TPA: hypothetical protein VN151_07750 [Terracidiphilus sp.]|nr:hypothetical protein [Terracidiphilus sp.]
MGPASDAPSASDLAELIEEYIAAHPQAAVLEDGRVVFELRSAQYSVKDNHGRCVLQFWNDERNLLRTVVEVRERAGSLRLVTRRMGAPRTQSLELVSASNRRTPTTRDTSRRNYQRLLERVLARTFIGAKLEGFRSAMDLEHSFGPAYIRGRLLRGTAAEAVIGVSAAESASIIDGILTLGILWLDYCRQHSDGRRHFGGLKVIVPTGAWRTTAERMAWLNHAAADFQLFTLDEKSEELVQVEIRDTGNIESHLIHAFSPDAALARCQSGIDQLLALIPAEVRDRIEIRPRSSSEVSLLLHGLDFARVRHGASTQSFGFENELTFGAGPSETLLTTESEPFARELFTRLFEARHPEGLKTDPLFRLQPERWLESRLRTAMPELMTSLRADLLCSQVPALSSGERGMLDLLTLDRTRRLTILELKAEEDLHLPMQALDYWIRVRALNADRKPSPANAEPVSAFTRAGYFPGEELSPLPPRLLLAAPALRIHPANEPVLRYFSPEIAWELIALGEHWRSELKIVFRKRGSHTQ